MLTLNLSQQPPVFTNRPDGSNRDRVLKPQHSEHAAGFGRLQHLVQAAKARSYALRAATSSNTHGLDCVPATLPSLLAFVKPESPARVLVHVTVAFMGGSFGGGGGGGGSTASSILSYFKRSVMQPNSLTAQYTMPSQQSGRPRPSLLEMTPHACQK